jgi:hypothetical protein
LVPDLLVMAVLATLAGPALAASPPANEAQRITTTMKAEFDQPGQPLLVEPVSVEGGFAVAGWRQGSMGGRALLQLNGGQWQIALCAGDALLRAETLTGAGMPADAAQRLLVRVRAAEARLEPAVRARLSSFSGITRMQRGERADQHDHH